MDPDTLAQVEENLADYPGILLNQPLPQSDRLPLVQAGMAQKDAGHVLTSAGGGADGGPAALGYPALLRKVRSGKPHSPPRVVPTVVSSSPTIPPSQRILGGFAAG